MNLFLLGDVYKSGHRFQQAAGTESMFDTMTPRSSKYFPIPGIKDVTVFGIQRFIRKWLVDEFDKFFALKVDRVANEYQRRMDKVLGTGKVNADHIRSLHELGYLPLRVRGIKEGMSCGIKVPMLSVENTHPDFAWLVGYFEDLWSNELWKPTTIATIAREYHKLFKQYADETCDSDDHVAIQGHDFSLRGLGNMGDADDGNLGHFVYFEGSDNLPAMEGVEEYYDSLVGSSIPATEHSVTCLNIAVNMKKYDLSIEDAEEHFLEHLLTKVYPTGAFSFVADTNNYFHTIGVKAANLKDVIMARDGKIVFRPDSGNPLNIICGYIRGGEYNSREEAADDIIRYNNYVLENNCEFYYEAVEISGEWYRFNIKNNIEVTFTKLSSDELIGSLEVLGNIFGTTVNSKGFKELDPHVGLIYGDSITHELAGKILARMKENGWASNNVVFGIGSFTYQYLTRDSLSFAIKATAAVVNGVGDLMLAKNPATDDGTKKSAKGYTVVQRDKDGNTVLIDGLTKAEYEEAIKDDAYIDYFWDGSTGEQWNLTDIRENAGINYSF